MNTNTPCPKLAFAALRGGSGKTIVSLGLTRALLNRGKNVAVFKKGPDYIDAAWLSRAADRPCYNLDTFLMGQNDVIRSFVRRSGNADISVIEGNRGLYDGMDTKGTFSTAELALMLGAPVVLVVDCTKVTRTMAAMICGCRDLDPRVNIAGVILNRVAGNRHRKILKSSIEEYSRIPVLGAIPRLKKDPLPMRHLGLTPTDEYSGPDEALNLLAQIVEDHIDIDKLMDTAGQSIAEIPEFEHAQGTEYAGRHAKNITLGVLRDASFQFYYPENIEALEQAGARVVFLNAVNDCRLPELHAMYIGGGFPETQAHLLSSNKDFMAGLRKLIEAGLPVYAECGGLMYLGRNILWKGNSFRMLDVINWDFVLNKKPVGHGYSILKFHRDSPFFKQGDRIQGHEFHYSQPVPTGDRQKGHFCCKVSRGHGFDGTTDGFCYKNVLGLYTHIHALGNRKWARSMVDAATRFKNMIFEQPDIP